MSPTPSNEEELETTSSNQLGAHLAELRQTKGLSHNDVSSRTKYAVLQLKALENEQWDVLPSGMPLRWMVKSYARCVDADETVVLSLLEATNHGARPPTGTPSDIRKGADLGHADMALHSESRPRSWGWLIVIAVLLLIALFYALDQGWIPEEWLVFDWLKEF